MRRLGETLPPALRTDLDLVLAGLEARDGPAAIAAIERVTRVHGDPALASYLIGLTSIRLGEPGKALRALNLAHELAPELREYAEALAILHAHLGHVVESLYFGKLATASTAEFGLPGLLPDWLGAFGHVFFEMREAPLIRDAESLLAAGQYALAADTFRKQTEVEPDAAAAWRGYATAQLAEGRVLDAAEAAGRLLELPDALPSDRSLHAECLAASGRWDEAVAAHRRATHAAADDPAVGAAFLRTLARRPAPDDGLLAAAAASFRARFALPFDRPAPPDQAMLAGRRLRVGVVSGRWGVGEGLDLIVPVLDQFDRRIVELHVYAEDPAGTPLARVLRGRADRWLDIAGMDDDTVAFVLRNDRPDVLIDLDGPTGCRRPVLFLAQAAPLSLSLYAPPGAAAALGFDAVLAGAGPARQDTIRVAGGILALPIDLPPADPIGVPRPGPPVFGMQAPWGSVDGPVLAAWTAVLTAVPGARLVLEPGTLGGPRAAAAALGTLSSRLPDGTVTVVPQAEPALDYLRRIDLLLAPPDHPYPDAAITATGLGVPVLTLRSRHPRAAMLADWLDRIGLADLLADDPTTLAAAAMRHATEAGRAALGARLAAAIPAERDSGPRRTAHLLVEALARAVVGARA